MNNKYPPDLTATLNLFKKVIFAELNCIQIAKIENIDTSKQTVSAQIQVKHNIDKQNIKSYPLITDIPIIVMQGGGAFLNFPIKKGDYCLLFFNDRDIDNWWTGGSETFPNSERKHSLSDGFALVGINSENSALNLDGSKVILDATDKEVEIKGSKLTLLEGTDFAVRFNELKTAFNSLKQSYDTLVELFNAHIHVTTATVGATAVVGTIASTLTPGSAATADIDPAKCDKINIPGAGE